MLSARELSAALGLPEPTAEQAAVIEATPEGIARVIAGAGSGKTTVLTKRVEFLCKFRAQNPKKVLCITFTRKAKQEMEHRLEKLEIDGVEIETFNSFCEKILKKKGGLIYNDEVKVATYSDKIKIVSNAMKKRGTTLDAIADDYFNKRQLREKSKDELFFIFVNDIFSIIDFYKNLQSDIGPFYEQETHSTKKRLAKLVYEISVSVEEDLKKANLRDFSDQILDTIRLFKEHKEHIPEYDHILVDEFQDINLSQNNLLSFIAPLNLFAVGDPRQAIYGWRGSDISFILDFPKQRDDTQVISLKKNYRSNNQIVEASNISIQSLGLVDLESNKPVEENSLFLIEQDSESLEKIFVTEAIKNSKTPRNEIFVLARTNRILENFADHFRKADIKFAIKSEEEYKSKEPSEDEITLATVHSIKGMEASEVYLISANTLSFPNKVQDNFVLALAKSGDNYDKYAEELRLFYVAISRAKDKLVISYTGNSSKFITTDLLKLFNHKSKNKSLFDFADKKSTMDSGNTTILKNMLKDWRTAKSNQTGLPLYMILSNTAIEDICRLKPQNKVELNNVNGLGELKIAKYGDEILKIVCG